MTSSAASRASWATVLLRIAFVSLQIENVTNATFGKLGLFLGNAFENKSVESIVSPRVIEFQSLVNDERKLVFVGHLDGKVKRVVMTGALKHLHPVKDVAAFSCFRRLLSLVNPARKDPSHLPPLTTIELGAGGSTRPMMRACG